MVSVLAGYQMISSGQKQVHGLALLLMAVYSMRTEGILHPS
jgi:hypothetical protein